MKAADAKLVVFGPRGPRYAVEWWRLLDAIEAPDCWSVTVAEVSAAWVLHRLQPLSRSLVRPLTFARGVGAAMAAWLEGDGPMPAMPVTAVWIPARDWHCVWPDEPGGDELAGFLDMVGATGLVWALDLRPLAEALLTWAEPIEAE